MASRVPSIAQVRPGAAASIILKQDQPTGRQVQGIVQDVLTRGNHPRGIKVRLQDGRIGRVQGMLSSLSSSTASGGELSRQPTAAAAAVAELQTDLQNQQQRARQSSRPYRSERLGVRYTDVRKDDDIVADEQPPAEMDLMSFVKTAKPKKGKKKGAVAAAAAAASTKSDGLDGSTTDGFEEMARRMSTDNAVCPVCNSFRGDENAVARHVATHFESS